MAAGIPVERIVVAGFSQGGALALHSLRQGRAFAAVVGALLFLPCHGHAPPKALPVKDVVRKAGRMTLPYIGSAVIAVVALLLAETLLQRGRYIWPYEENGTEGAGLSSWVPLHEEAVVVSPEAQKTAVFLGHGDQDQLVTYDKGTKSAALLKEKGLQVEFHTYPMPHSACEAELRDLAVFLKRVIP